MAGVVRDASLVVAPPPGHHSHQDLSRLLPPRRLLVAPIRCVRTEISYDIPTGRLLSVTVYGYPADDRNIERRTRRLRSYERGGHALSIVTRRYHVFEDIDQVLNVPGWLDELIEKYRPAGGAR